MRVKICGITQATQGKAIANLGATDLGFICVEASKRYVTASQIGAVVQNLSRSINRIGVFANTTIDNICQVVTQTDLTGVQLHGDESPEFCQQLRGSLPAGVEIIKAIRVKTPAALDRANDYAGIVDTLLLDAYHRDRLGGTGQVLDWGALQQFSPDCPWLLAGGLTPDNILDALRQVNPTGIDLSSGVERSPGDKDLAKVARLFQQLNLPSTPLRDSLFSDSYLDTTNVPDRTPPRAV
jgi:phosphoribosylanthranilate isomerase